MKKTLVLIPLVLFLFFAFIFLTGLAFGNLVRQANADGFMPYDFISKNDIFRLTLKAGSYGQISTITYGYEYAD